MKTIASRTGGSYTMREPRRSDVYGRHAVIRARPAGYRFDVLSPHGVHVAVNRDRGPARGFQPPPTCNVMEALALAEPLLLTAAIVRLL